MRIYRLVEDVPEIHIGGKEVLAKQAEDGSYDIFIDLDWYDNVNKELVENTEIWLQCPKKTVPHSFVLKDKIFVLKNNEDKYIYTCVNNKKNLSLELKPEFWEEPDSINFQVQALINTVGEIFSFSDKVRYEKESSIFVIDTFTYCVGEGWFINDHEVPETIKPNLETLKLVQKAQGKVELDEIEKLKADHFLERITKVLDSFGKVERIENIKVFLISDIDMIFGKHPFTDILREIAIKTINEKR